MSQKVVSFGDTIEVAIVDTSDWIWSNKAVKLKAIGFTAGAVSDKGVVRNGGVAAPRLPAMLSVDGSSQMVQCFGAEIVPCIKYTDGVYTAGSYFTFFLDRD